MKAKIILTALIILSFRKLFSQDKVALQSWHNNKYSMFIQFCVYSELGGVWNGKPNDNGYSELIQVWYRILIM